MADFVDTHQLALYTSNLDLTYPLVIVLRDSETQKVCVAFRFEPG